MYVHRDQSPSSATCLSMSMHESLLNQQKDVVQPWPFVWCFAKLGLRDKCCDSSFHSCTTCIKTGIWRGRTGIRERSLLCNPYDKEELSVVCILPGNSDGTSIHLPCASHVSSVQMFWQRHKLPCVVYPAASSFGCPVFLLLRTRMFQSPVCNIYHCLFIQQLIACTKWAYTYCPKWFCQVLAPFPKGSLSV